MVLRKAVTKVKFEKMLELVIFVTINADLKVTGLTVGVEEGSLLGSILGLVDGCRLGFVIGAIDGIMLGLFNG